tara:strand:+ start:201742 stop:204189 length:2448 start_codon:yes stop_codon:yes gene_type:complete
MEPYTAIIRDSFHSALSSRILWVAFAAIWLLLAGLAPIGYREDFTTTFLGRDFENGTRLKAMLAEGLVGPDDKKAALGRIAHAMPNDLQRQLRRVAQGDEVRIRYSVLSDALNELLDDESWYDADAWSDRLRLRELRELDQLSGDEMTESLRRRRARLRIEAALPGVFQTRSSRSIVLTYAGMDFPANFQVDKSQFVTLINQWVVPTIVNWLLGFILVFLGILVTASIVPDMLQPGSLHLLLSKPVSRTMLLLSKFVGGCSFVFLCVVQLIIGLYLIAGLRLDLWNIRIMWCIPVSVFLFAVFYSVSTLAGLKWRSPILAIGITCMFGAFCLIVGVIGGFFDALVSGPDRIRSLVTVDDTIVAATRGGGLIRFDTGQNRWIEIIESDPMKGDRILAPIALDDRRVATANVRGGRFNPYGSGSLDLLVLSKSSGWEPEPSVRLPTGTTQLVSPDSDAVYAITTGALMKTNRQQIIDKVMVPEDETSDMTQASTDHGRETDGNQATDSDVAAAKPKYSKLTGWLSRLTGMQGGSAEGFQNVLPSSVVLTPPRSLSLSADGSAMVALTQGRLIRIQSNPIEPQPGESDQQWTVTANRSLAGETPRGSELSVSGNIAMVTRPSEQTIEFFDAITLEPIGTTTLDSSLAVDSSIAIDDNEQFAVVTSDGRCRMVRTSSQPEPSSIFVASISDPLPVHDVDTLIYDSRSGQLVVVHHVDQIDWFDLQTSTVVKRLRPSLDRWRLVDKYVITPLRTVTPQTGELGQTIASMISGESSFTVNNGAGAETETVRYKIARPVISCAGFILVMLTISCVYFARRDF